MHPELESFLDQAFQSIQPTSPNIGRVVVEPDYEIEPSQADAAGLQNELLQFLSTQSTDNGSIASPEGFEVKIPSRFALLTKYLRAVTLHQNKLDGSWVEIAPPGNWI